MNKPAGQAFIGLTNPKSPSNVGSVLRAAGCFAATQILYTGNRFDKARAFHTDTKKVAEHIPLTRCDDFFAAKIEGMQVICVDLIEGAIALPDFQHPENALYIFGPEDGSIDQATINQADHVVFIPTIGCLNLAASVNIVLYDRSAKLNNVAASDEQIRHSRDRNNATKVLTNRA